MYPQEISTADDAETLIADLVTYMDAHRPIVMSKLCTSANDTVVFPLDKVRWIGRSSDGAATLTYQVREADSIFDPDSLVVTVATLGGGTYVLLTGYQE